MMAIIKSVAMGRTKEEALQDFWDYQERYPGRRRIAPQKIVKILRVRLLPQRKGTWAIFYTIPARYYRDLHKPKVDA